MFSDPATNRRLASRIFCARVDHDTFLRIPKRRSLVCSVMALRIWSSVLCCAFALAACDDGGDENPTAAGSSSSTTDDVATTIPVTSVTDTSPDPTTTTATGGTDGTSSSSSTGEPDSTSTGSSSGGSTTESSSSSGDDTTTTTGDAVWTVGWCNLQHPPTIDGDTAATTTAYARVYVEGLTDQTPGNDLAPELQVAFGYGDDGSMPPDGWTWTDATANVGWNGNDAGEPNNDEYQADLGFAAPGTYDYAARVSGDGGTTWTYCDLDGLVEGGYTPEQAGHATIQ